MIEALRSLYRRMKIALFDAPVEAVIATQMREAVEQFATTPEIESIQVVATIAEPATTGTTSTDKWKVTPYHDPIFEKIGRVYLDNGDLVIRSDRDPRGFILLEGDLDQALTGGTGTVRLLDLTGTVGTARFSSSGMAMNIVIDQQLHTVPMRSLSLVLGGRHKRGPLFVPSEVMMPDVGGR